ncbi:MAG: NAD(P)/FAD-dependent oxidoreductase [Chloroflexi bacterium]|nr:NAD(P)/FAD-dependent oxidoreductase [Chloroflexota bacterium]
MAEKSYDVIVVGAGFGGSTCAALLAKRGLNVLLLEKNAKAAGKAMSISKKGFTHTAWLVHSAPAQDNLHEAILKELGVEDRAELIIAPENGSRYRNSSGQYAIGPQGSTPDPDATFAWLEVREEEKDDAITLLTDLISISPQDIDALDDISFQEWLGRYKVPRGVYSFLNFISDGCFMVPLDLVAASEALRTVQAVFLRGGGVFGKGGIGHVAEAIAQAVEEYGGKMITRARVEKITVDQGRVTGVITSKGVFQSPIVVSNAGIQPTVLKLVGEEQFDKSYVHYVKDLVPSWAMMGVRYFLDKKVINEPSACLFSDETGWTLERWLKTESGDIPKEISVWIEVPSNYDPAAAPPGKQIILTGTWCPADPQMTRKENQAWWDKVDEMMFKAFPDLKDHIESKEGYSSHDVSALTRDQVLPGQGGECIGLGQIVGQCGRHKPSIKAPVRGLFYVGCDAGGRGIGIQQAIDSGINVAQTVLRYHGLRQVFP